MNSDYENAMVAFKRSLEEDFSKDISRQGDMALTNFVMGECCIKKRQWDDAIVAYRKAAASSEVMLPAYVGILHAASINGDASATDYATENIVKLTSESYLEELKSNSGQGITVILFDGRADIVKADAFLGAFRKRSEVKHKVVTWRLNSATGGTGNLALADKLHDHLTDQGGFEGELSRQTSKAVAGTIMKQVPCLGLFAPSTDADVRYWATMPGRFFVEYLPLPAGEVDLNTVGYDKKDKAVQGMNLNWNNIPVREGQRTLLIATDCVPNPLVDGDS